MEEILINIEAGERRVAILKAKKLQWYLVERINAKRIVGNVYKGKVNAVLDGMGAAFVDCGFEKNGFLYIADITAPIAEDEDSDFLFPTNGEAASVRKEPHAHITDKTKISQVLKKDQDILVQIVKEELGTKGARLTTHISLAGRHLVLMPTSSRIGVSRKIKSEEERRRIKTILHELKPPDDIGLVARTAAEGAEKRDFLKDINYLLDTYNRIKRLAKEKDAPVLLYEELDLSLKVIRDFLTDNTQKVIVDDKEEFKKLRAFAARIAPRLINKIVLYKEDTPLFEKFEAEKEIDKLFERKIYLKCGGHITIEQTEGMVAIDVNSGKFTGKKDLEDTVFKVNKEAAEEIARQIRLRDIGGIIVIDFIDMESQHHRKEVFSILQNALKSDRAKTNVISMSELDIVEMTRQRVRKSLESVSYQNCPYCDGKGMVRSDATMVIIALRRLKAFLRTQRSKRAIELKVHPRIAQRLVMEDAPSLDFLRRRFSRRITVVADDTLHVEEVKIDHA